jgi:phosphotransferase system  glucose/maltose/N-acetylglucosamine-specific IIC component
MRRWHSLIDIIAFPLKILFLASILMGIGGLILNPNLQNIFTVESQLIISFAELLRYFGSFMILNFPLFVMIKALSKRFSESVPVFIGVIGYVVFHITTLFFSKATLPAEAYLPVFGLNIDLSLIALEGTGIQYPIHTGIIAALLVVLITRVSYRISRRASGYGVLSFIDRDMWAAIYTMVLSALAGLLITTIWPTIIAGITFIFKFIASDITNPMNLFVYGVSDRFLAGVGLSQLIREPFWFTSLGGSWVNAVGTNVVGDVAIWTQQITEGLTTIGFGRLYTPYYVLNLFAIPAFIVGIFQTFTDKFERRKFRGFIAVAVLLAITVGMLFPFEMFLLFLAPLVYVAHILFTGVLFALFQAINVSLGYTFSGLNIVATPTSIADIILFARNPNLQSSIVSIMVVGAITAVVYFLLARVYFNYLAYDMMNTGKKKETVNELFTVFGGIDNIRIVHSSLYRVTILPIKKNRVDFSLSPLEDVTKISESRAGYSLTFGAGSYIIRTAMIKKIKEHQKELLEAKKSKNKLENV